MPTDSRPIPSLRGLRPTATRSSPPSTAQAVAELDDAPARAAADALGLHPDADVDAMPLAQCPRDLLAGERLLARQQPLFALDQRDGGAERRPGLRQLAADRAAAEHEHALRHPLRGRPLAVVPGIRPSRGPSIGGIAAPLPVATTTAARAQDVVADDHAALAVEPALAAEQLDPAFFQPRHLARVVEVVDHLVTAGEHRLAVQLADRLGDAGHAPSLAQQLAGRSRAFEGMQA